MKIESIEPDKLVLDPNNDRFAELYSGSTNEDDLINYLLHAEAASEVAKSISARKEFYPDEALWVTAQGKNFLVKDGNRRCAAVKALQNPSKYGLGLPKLTIQKVPTLIYKDVGELERRIQEKHTHNFFMEWEPIAKALKVHEMQKAGSTDADLKEIDSNPARLMKLASFYYEAVKVGGEDLKALLRRGKTGGGSRTIIFERLFSHAPQCGYTFKGKPGYEIDVIDKKTFDSYIKSIIAYLQANPKTTHADVDRYENKSAFLDGLKQFGFISTASSTPTSAQPKGAQPNLAPPPVKRGTVKTKPIFTRKGIAPKLKRLIDECYSLDNSQYPNAKVALSRVVFESVLKYVVTETSYKGKRLKDYSHFHNAFYSKKGNRLPYANFTQMRTDFIDLISNAGTKKAFQQFDLEQLHQVIHNYLTGVGPRDAQTVSENLLSLVEFMLLDENDLISSLDTKKL